MLELFAAPGLGAAPTGCSSAAAPTSCSSAAAARFSCSSTDASAVEPPASTSLANGAGARCGRVRHRFAARPAGRELVQRREGAASGVAQYCDAAGGADARGAEPVNANALSAGPVNANPHADCEGKSITRAREDFDHCVSNVFAETEKEKSFTNSDVNAYTFAASKKEIVAFARTLRNADPNSK